MFLFSNNINYRLFKATPKEIQSIKTAGDILSSMIGVGEDSDIEFLFIVKQIDRFLKRNGEKRMYK